MAPMNTERAVITAKASKAPENTINLDSFMAMIAAMKNVLSPSSETKITDKDDKKP